VTENWGLPLNRKILGTVVVSAAALMLTACGASSAPVNWKPGSTSAPAGEQSAPAEATEAAQIDSLPFNASGLLGGNAKPKFGDGQSGVVSVVQIGPLEKDSGTLLFAFRNNTSEAISHVDWTATARSGGKIVATGSSQGGTPAQVQPGEVGLAYIYFDNAKAIPKNAEYEFTVSISPVDTSSFNTAPLKVTEANLVGGSIVGSATNKTGAELQGPYSVHVYCFKGDKLQMDRQTYAEQTDNVAPGGKVTFSADLYGDTCPTFAVGVSGYFS
jgi:hypothetical protein